MIICYKYQCPHLTEEQTCSKYAMEYMLFVTRRGYCPVLDKYEDDDKQAAYEKSKKSGMSRVGQQKQKRR